MSFFRLLVIAVLLFGAYKLTTHLFGGSASAGAFKDTQGKTHSLSGAQKPVVLGFWIEGCPSSDAVISVLNDIRVRYPEDKVEVLSFYLNTIDDSALASLAAQEGVRVPALQAQRTQEEHERLRTRFGLEGPAVYVVDKGDRISTIPAAEDSVEVLRKAMESLDLALR